ncbi:NEW3 domain-containing protein [Streptomyces millisiae]
MALSGPERVTPGTPFACAVEVTAVGGTVPAGGLALDLPAGWTAVPERHRLPAIRAGRSRSVAFEVTPAAGERPEHRIRAVLAGDGWTAGAVDSVTTAGGLGYS